MGKGVFRAIGVAVLIGVAAAMGAVAAQDANYIGKWQGTDSGGETATVIFGQDGSFTMVIDGTEVIGGNSTDGTVGYAFDLTKDPAWLDIILYDAAGEEIGRLLSIVKFTGPDTMLWRMNDDPAVRPTELDENDTENTVQMTRIQ